MCNQSCLLLPVTFIFRYNIFPFGVICNRSAALVCFDFGNKPNCHVAQHLSLSVCVCLCVCMCHPVFPCQCAFQYVISRLNLLQSMTATRRSQKANCEWQQSNKRATTTCNHWPAQESFWPALHYASQSETHVCVCKKFIQPFYLFFFLSFFMLHLSICSQSGQSFLCTSNNNNNNSHRGQSIHNLSLCVKHKQLNNCLTKSKVQQLVQQSIANDRFTILSQRYV